MRRVKGLAALGRAIAGEFAGAARTSAAARRGLLPQVAAATFNSRLPSFAGRSSDGFSQLTLIPSMNHGFPATMCFSSAASPAKEPQSSDKFLPKDAVLYQYEACPFCNKVKAFLDFHNVPYKVVEVNPINKKEIKWSDYKKVPILKVDGENMVDSSVIIDNLYQKINPDNPALDSEEEKKWRRWVDNHLVHVLSPNIYRTASEALESFDYITSHGNFSFSERIIAKYGGAAAMYFVSKKLKKRHNITDERAAFYEAVETWVDALKGRQFLGGSSPNLADISVFGVLRPIRHLQSGRDMVSNTRIGEWYNRMEGAVGESSRIKA
ncbi:Prostaglandin E synthase 2 [Morus notabilis]|uniref:Prostaglandin E synthase 2 n=1 Tax=Morus notabilis TaxID=981085 RepID=W9R9U2_9ROSA|nr:prostaglandin E synthase 2 [Morus notabilis]EXB60646.1 Prostaglandin E synthase 2 [Morus notabilis]